MSNEDPIEIQPAGWPDLPGIWQLEQACFGRDAWGVIDLGIAFIARAVRLKAVSGPQLIGFVMGEPRPNEGFAWIATIGVHPRFQRRGIGARLLAEVEARLTTPAIKLTVRASNTGAIALYEKFGYRAVTTWPRYYASGEAGIVMEKRRDLKG